MTIDTTEAKIGRSMKNREIMMADDQRLILLGRCMLGLAGSLIACRVDVPGSARSEWRLAPCAGAADLPRRLAGGAAVLPEESMIGRRRRFAADARRQASASRSIIRLDLHLRADLQNPADDDPIAFRQIALLAGRLDHSQAVVLERAGLHGLLLHLVVFVHRVDILQALIRSDGAIDHQQRRMRLADRQMHPDEHSGRKNR